MPKCLIGFYLVFCVLCRRKLEIAFDPLKLDSKMIRKSEVSITAEFGFQWAGENRGTIEHVSPVSNIMSESISARVQCIPSLPYHKYGTVVIALIAASCLPRHYFIKIVHRFPCPPVALLQADRQLYVAAGRPAKCMNLF